MGKLAVFDVDGTILDSFGLYERVTLEYSREQGLPAPCLATIRRGYGDPHNHDFKWGVPRAEQITHLHATFAMVDAWSMSREADKTPLLFDGVTDGLKDLKNKGYTLAIVTSKPEAPLLHLLDHHGIRGLFSAHRAWDDIKRRGEKEKPEPDMLRSVMNELSFVAADTVMIGDTTMDIRMGRSAQARTIGVTWGTHLREDLEGAGAHHIVDTRFDDVVATIGRTFS
jgi:phosphoglycolate phosphatase